jgi:hypothetical protein
MKLKAAILSVLTGSSAIAAPAFAHEGWHHEYHRYYVPAPVYYRPAPRVVYVPAPVYYRPAPAYLAPVVVAPGFSIRFNLPL